MKARAFAAGALATAVAAGAAAQGFDVDHPRTLVVGAPPGARAERVDAARTGRSRDPLPGGSLRTAWRIPLGALVETAPLVDARGDVYVVGTRGEIVVVDRDGGERWRASTGAVQPGPGALLSDDTLVFADALGEAVAVRDGAVRWRSRFGRGDASHPAPIPLLDGGVVVATAHDLAVLDAEGGERSRVALPEAASGPLLWAAGKVIAVGASGAVWTWQPGAQEARRAGHLGGAVEGGGAMVDERTLLAVVAGGSRLVALDLSSGVATTRAAAPGGAWLGPPSVARGSASLVLLGATSELAVTLDATGAETARALLAMRAVPATSLDGGAPTILPVPHAPLLVDDAGSVAFATVEGALGVARGATVELLPDACSPAVARGSGVEPSRVAGLAPLGPGMIVAACREGSLLAVRAAAAPGEPSARHL